MIPPDPAAALSCSLDLDGLVAQRDRYARIGENVLDVSRAPRSLSVHLSPAVDVALVVEASASSASAARSSSWASTPGPASSPWPSALPSMSQHSRRSHLRSERRPSLPNASPLAVDCAPTLFGSSLRSCENNLAASENE